MKIEPPQPRLSYGMTPSLPVGSVEYIAPDIDKLREVDGRIARALIALYAKRYGNGEARKLIQALSEKYAFG